MNKFAIVTSSLSTKNRITTMNSLLLTASFFKETTAKLFTKFKHRRSTLNTSEILDLSNNSGIIKPCELSPKKTASSCVKTIEEFDLAACFDKSEIIAAAVSRNRYLRSYHDNPTKEKSRYDREKEDYEERHNQRQSSQLRGN